MVASTFKSPSYFIAEASSKNALLLNLPKYSFGIHVYVNSENLQFL